MGDRPPETTAASTIPVITVPNTIVPGSSHTTCTTAAAEKITRWKSLRV